MTKRDWRLILVAFATLAVLWTVGSFIAAAQWNRTDRTTERLQELSVNVTASLCLQAYAPENGDPSERDLVLAYVEGRPIPLTNEVCRKAVEKARRQVEGKEAD